jgi:PEP-CTERM motif
MSKRSFLFGTLVLLAGLASATPSRAGSVLTSISYSSASPGLTEIDLAYSDVGTLGAPTPGTFTGGTATLVGDVVELKFSPSSTGPFSFSFTMTDTLSSGATATPTFTPSGSSLTAFSFSVTQSSVPEPASIALLGIGMTGFLAFRRFRKKASAA